MKRIQRRRVKGWKMPRNTTYVGRGSKWGNPFKLMGDMIYVDAGHRRKILSKWVLFYQDGGHTIEEVVALYYNMIINNYKGEVEPEIKQKFTWIRENIQLLKGKNLACWCSNKSCCHGDVLLDLVSRNVLAKLANKK